MKSILLILILIGFIYTQISYKISNKSTTISYTYSNILIINNFSNKIDLQVKERPFAYFKISLSTNTITNNQVINLELKPVDFEGYHTTITNIISNDVILYSLPNINTQIDIITNINYISKNIINPDFNGRKYNINITNQNFNSLYLSINNQTNFIPVFFFNEMDNYIAIERLGSIKKAGESFLLFLSVRNMAGMLLDNYNGRHTITLVGLLNSPNGELSTYNGYNNDQSFNIDFVNGVSSIDVIAYKKGFNLITLKIDNKDYNVFEDIIVIPSDINVNNTEIILNNIAPVFGDTINFSIKTKDSYGNQLEEGNNDIKIKLNNTDNINVIDNLDGTYHANYLTDNVGSNFIEIFINDIKFKSEIFINGFFSFLIEEDRNDIHHKMLDKLGHLTKQESRFVACSLSISPIPKHKKNVDIFVRGLKRSKVNIFISTLYGKIINQVANNVICSGGIDIINWNLLSKKGHKIGEGIYLITIIDQDNNQFMSKFYVE